MLVTRCWLAVLAARRAVRARACFALLCVRSQVRRLSPKYQSGLLPEFRSAQEDCSAAAGVRPWFPLRRPVSAFCLKSAPVRGRLGSQFY